MLLFRGLTLFPRVPHKVCRPPWPWALAEAGRFVIRILSIDSILEVAEVLWHRTDVNDLWAIA